MTLPAMKIFSGNANPALAQEICQNLGAPLGSATVNRFPDGETFVQINENIRGCDVFIIQPTCPPTNNNLMELLIMIDAIKRGVPVMAHIGLTPQSVNTLGGYKVVGREGESDAVMADALAVQEAGAFSVVLEKVPVGLSARITERLEIPTIGIGAGVHCDGQVLVVDDMLGLFTDFRPKFVKRYAELGQAADQAIATYAAEVRARSFPADEHGFADVLPTKDKP